VQCRIDLIGPDPFQSVNRLHSFPPVGPLDRSDQLLQLGQGFEALKSRSGRQANALVGIMEDIHEPPAAFIEHGGILHLCRSRKARAKA
jgi:hypothetical protein